MVSCASEGVRRRGVCACASSEVVLSEGGSWRIIQGGGPSAGFVLLAILVLGVADAEGSMLTRAEAGPAKSQGFELLDMVWYGFQCLLLLSVVGVVRFLVSNDSYYNLTSTRSRMLSSSDNNDILVQWLVKIRGVLQWLIGTAKLTSLLWIKLDILPKRIWTRGKLT